MKIAKALGHALPRSRQQGRAAIKAESVGPAGKMEGLGTGPDFEIRGSDVILKSEGG